MEKTTFPQRREKMQRLAEMLADAAAFLADEAQHMIAAEGRFQKRADERKERKTVAAN